MLYLNTLHHSPNSTNPRYQVGTIYKGEGNLKGRAIAVPLLFDSAGKVRPIWIIGLYAPAQHDLHPKFFEDLNKWWKDNLEKQECFIVAGDLNAHLLDPILERSSLENSFKNDLSFRNFVEEHHLEDTTRCMGAFDLDKLYTHKSYSSGLLTRLDYQLTTDLPAVLQHRVFNVARIATPHRLIVTRFDLFQLSKCWKSPVPAVTFPHPLHFNKKDQAKAKQFREEESKWIERQGNLYFDILKADPTLDTITDDQEEAFLAQLSDLCCTRARRIWANGGSFQRKPWRSKEVGIILSQITWINRAMEGLNLLIRDSDPLDSRKINWQKRESMFRRLTAHSLLPHLDATNWHQWSKTEAELWWSSVKNERQRLRQQRDQCVKDLKEKDKKKREGWLIREGIKNSRAFRRSRLWNAKDPDGEAVLDKAGNILVTAKLILQRYEEYYSELFGGEPPRTVEENQEHARGWLDPDLIESNRRKLNEALQGRSIADQVPTMEEYLRAVNKGTPSSAPGRDGIQYGALQLLGYGTHKCINNLIGTWWRKRKLPKILAYVEVCSIHKKGDKLNLFNKRGIGLVSKIVLIMETVLLERISTALAKAGTRSHAQGGATTGVGPMDTVAALINVISDAYRKELDLFLAEYDLQKFFDSIPQRAFRDAHCFFGFDKNTVDLVAIFWSGFKGAARTKYGVTGLFLILIGNIQGLGGSPMRSALVLDMFLIQLQRSGLGYVVASDYANTPETQSDTWFVRVYAIAWIDDIWLIARTFKELQMMHKMYLNFVNYYSLSFVTDKCHIYSLLHTAEATNWELRVDTFQGKTSTIKLVENGASFRCLGAWFSLCLSWNK